MKKRKNKSKRIYYLIFILELVLLLVYGNKVITITEYEVQSPKITEEIKIAQISDLHNGRFGNMLEKKLQYINPDFIAITGDLIDSNKLNLDLTIKYLKDMLDIAPVFYVSGNHEGWASDIYDTLLEKMQKMGVTILNGESRELSVNENKIIVMGIDDPSINNNINQLDNLLYDRNEFVLLLSHRPELFELYQNRGIDLVLTGHAHGGQFRIPFVGGVIAPNQGFFPKYSSGMFSSNDNTKMIVSRGIGNSVIPLRINNPPEIVVVKLVSKEKET